MFAEKQRQITQRSLDNLKLGRLPRRNLRPRMLVPSTPTVTRIPTPGAITPMQTHRDSFTSMQGTYSSCINPSPATATKLD